MANHMNSTAHRFFEEVLNSGRVEVIDEVCTEDFVEHEEVPGFSGTGRESVHFLVEAFRSAVPDLHT